MVQWVGLWFSIVTFPCHTHLFVVFCCCFLILTKDFHTDKGSDISRAKLDCFIRVVKFRTFKFFLEMSTHPPLLCQRNAIFADTVKPVLSGHLK